MTVQNAWPRTMTAEEMTEVPNSPCVGVCRLSGDVCEGCGRKLAEIAAWPTASTAKKQAIALAARARLATIQTTS